MKTNEFKTFLASVSACEDARQWCEGKTLKEAWETCHRGDWMLWLFAKTNPEDKRLLTLAKGLCAQTVTHLMKDERSKAAVKAAIDYGNSVINEDKLNNAADAAYAAYADAAYAAAYAAYAAAAYAAAAAAADADYAAYAAYAADAAYAARKKSQQQTADIVRSIIPFEKITL